MSNPFMGEIRIMSFSQNPKGWAQCNGQFLPINQNQALFSILGTTYGGNGQTTFALPDFRGRVPIYQGQGFILGERGGEEAHTVNMSEMPQHIHSLNCQPSATGEGVDPTNAFFSDVALKNYGAFNVANAIQIVAGTVSNVGGSQPHENRQPFLVVNFCIALSGIFPSRN